MRAFRGNGAYVRREQYLDRLSESEQAVEWRLRDNAIREQAREELGDVPRTPEGALEWLERFNDRVRELHAEHEVAR